MKLDTLTAEQIKEVYETRMKEDFPPDELKPLPMIYKLLETGNYECLGLFWEESEGTNSFAKVPKKQNENFSHADCEKKLAGYTFLNKVGSDYLIDYLATFPNQRNQGLGGIMLQLLCDKLKTATSILGEVENPAMEQNEVLRNLQSRRVQFYLRNGFWDTGVTATCFGVPFLLIETGHGGRHSQEEIQKLYKMHYKTMLPKNLYEENVFVSYIFV